VTPPSTPPAMAPTGVDLLVLGERPSVVELELGNDVDDDANVDDANVDCDGKLLMFGLVANVSNEGM